MSTLTIGKALYKILSDHTGITDRVNKKIYPLIADDNTSFPFIVYRRSGILEHETKDKMYGESVEVELVIVTDRYDESIVLAEMIKDIFESTRGIIENIDIRKIQITDAEEEYSDNAFVQKLTLKINTNKNGK